MPETPPYRDVPGYPTPPAPAPTPTGPASGSFFSDEARARLWCIGGSQQFHPPLMPGAQIHAANLRATNEVGILPTLPARLITPENRADLLGVAVVVDESSLRLVFQIAQNYPGAIAKKHDVVRLGQYHDTYQALGMYHTTLVANAVDIHATHQAYGKYIIGECDDIIAGIKESAAAGDPSARAALSQIEDNERKLKEKRRNAVNHTQQAKEEGQGDLARLTALYEQALGTMEQQRQEMAALRHELTLARSATPPVSPPPSAGRPPARATPR